jgi:hypothetical protein
MLRSNAPLAPAHAGRCASRFEFLQNIHQITPLP